MPSLRIKSGLKSEGELIPAWEITPLPFSHCLWDPPDHPNQVVLKGPWGPGGWLWPSTSEKHITCPFIHSLFSFRSSFKGLHFFKAKPVHVPAVEFLVWKQVWSSEQYQGISYLLKMSVFFSSLLEPSQLLFAWKPLVSPPVPPGSTGEPFPPCTEAGAGATVASGFLSPHSCGRRLAPHGPPALPTAGIPPLAHPAGNRSSTSAGPPQCCCAACAGSPSAAAHGLPGQRDSAGCALSSPAAAPSFLPGAALWWVYPAAIPCRRQKDHHLCVAVNPNPFDTAMKNSGLFWMKFIPVSRPEGKSPLASIGFVCCSSFDREEVKVKCLYLFCASIFQCIPSKGLLYGDRAVQGSGEHSLGQWLLFSFVVLCLHCLAVSSLVYGTQTPRSCCSMNSGKRESKEVGVEKTAKNIFLNKGNVLKRRNSRTNNGDGKNRKIHKLAYFYRGGSITFPTTLTIYFTALASYRTKMTRDITWLLPDTFIPISWSKCLRNIPVPDNRISFLVSTNPIRALGRPACGQERFASSPGK